jgi:hypothetical protein
MKITNDMKRFIEKNRSTRAPVSGWPRFYGSRGKNLPHRKSAKSSNPIPSYVQASHVGWRMQIKIVSSLKIWHKILDFDFNVVGKL